MSTPVTIGENSRVFELSDDNKNDNYVYTPGHYLKSIWRT